MYACGGDLPFVAGATDCLVDDFTDERKYASGGILNPALAVPHDPAVPRRNVPVFMSKSGHEG